MVRWSRLFAEGIRWPAVLSPCHRYSCDLSVDGQWVVTGGADSLVRIWSTFTGAVQAVLTGHSKWVSGSERPLHTVLTGHSLCVPLRPVCAPCVDGVFSMCKPMLAAHVCVSRRSGAWASAGTLLRSSTTPVLCPRPVTTPSRPGVTSQACGCAREHSRWELDQRMCVYAQPKRVGQIVVSC